MTVTARHPEVAFLGLRFARCDADDTLAWVRETARGPAFAALITPNVDHVVRLHREAATPEGAALQEAYDAADLLVCDSRVLALLAKRSGIALPVVTGSDLTASLLSTPLPQGTVIALIGGDEAERRWLAAAQPEATVLHHLPPMGLRSDPAARRVVAEFVEQSGAHITLLTVGSPQSEMIAQLIKTRGRARGVGLCVGASLEFLSRKKQRAPGFVQALHMEWAFRLLSEPRRLWRRYLIEGPAIFAIWLNWRRSLRV